jgi:protein disulfide-isomerase
MQNIVLGLVLAIMVVRVHAAEAKWLTDFNAAKEQAQKENKAILMDFGGSDWCVTCKALKRDVFSTPEFAAFAAKSLVLQEVDFPVAKKLPKDLQKANDKLGEKFNVEIYPTVLLVTKKGKEIGRVSGYEGESASDFIKKLEKLLAQAK